MLGDPVAAHRQTYFFVEPLFEGYLYSRPAGEAVGVRVGVGQGTADRATGAHLDVARHFFPKRELLALIDALAALKLNRVHLHLTDDQGWRIESRRYPALHEVGSHRPRTGPI